MKKNVTGKPGLYLHIPFCDTKCGYCDFYSITNHSTREDFLKALIQEIKHYASRPFTSAFFDTIYFGGGTPSLLTPKELGTIFDTLHQFFSIARDCEITLEANPGTVNAEKLQFYKQTGINRLSIGIQSFNDDELKYLGRIHNTTQAVASYHLAREHGFDNIGIDLIFALPGQSLASWKSNLKKAFDLKPQHISAYNLIFEEGTPFYNKRVQGEIKAKTENDELLFFSQTVSLMDKAGYEHYEVSNYAMSSNYYSRHNYKYWDHSNYLSFGPSAHSYWNKKRWSNMRSLSKYIKNINEHKTVIDFSEELAGETVMFEKIMLGLRTKAGINLDGFETNFRESFLTKHSKINSDLLQNGFAEIDNGHFKLTPKGLMICDEILPRFAPN
jgi:oxygen-independent coproporphyrinogen III oxidase